MGKKQGIQSKVVKWGLSGSSKSPIHKIQNAKESSNKNKSSVIIWSPECHKHEGKTCLPFKDATEPAVPTAAPYVTHKRASSFSITRAHTNTLTLTLPYTPDDKWLRVGVCFQLPHIQSPCAPNLILIPWNSHVGGKWMWIETDSPIHHSNYSLINLF